MSQRVSKGRRKREAKDPLRPAIPFFIEAQESILSLWRSGQVKRLDTAFAGLMAIAMFGAARMDQWARTKTWISREQFANCMIWLTREPGFRVVEGWPWTKEQMRAAADHLFDVRTEAQAIALWEPAERAVRASGLVTHWREVDPV